MHSNAGCKLWWLVCLPRSALLVDWNPGTFVTSPSKPQWRCSIAAGVRSQCVMAVGHGRILGDPTAAGCLLRGEVGAVMQCHGAAAELACFVSSPAMLATSYCVTTVHCGCMFKCCFVHAHASAVLLLRTPSDSHATTGVRAVSYTSTHACDQALPAVWCLLRSS